MDNNLARLHSLSLSNKSISSRSLRKYLIHTKIAEWRGIWFFKRTNDISKDLRTEERNDRIVPKHFWALRFCSPNLSWKPRTGEESPRKVLFEDSWLFHELGTLWIHLWNCFDSNSLGQLFRSQFIQKWYSSLPCRNSKS